jgi:hypothetical protein
MASKKIARSKGKTLRKTKSRTNSAGFPCPNPGEPLSLNGIVDRMEDDPGFAEFIRGLLCDSYTDETARTCLASYFKPTSRELTDLCIPKGCHKKMMMFCTVPPPTGVTGNLLIALPAHRFSKKR